MNDLLFRADDFTDCRWGTNEGIAFFANRILKEKLEQAPEVFTFQKEGQTVIQAFTNDIRFAEIPFVTHKARLVCVEEIKK